MIGIPGVAFAAFNGIVGMGIFALPGLVAGILGPAAILAYLLCLLVVALVGLCMAEAGSRVQSSGGRYAYARVAFGPVVGGVTGALLVTANTVVGAAAVVRFLLDTLAAISPVFASALAAFGLMAAGRVQARPVAADNTAGSIPSAFHAAVQRCSAGCANNMSARPAAACHPWRRISPSSWPAPQPA